MVHTERQGQTKGLRKRQGQVKRPRQGQGQVRRGRDRQKDRDIEIQRHKKDKKERCR